MKWVYPVRYQMIFSKESDQYFIVAENAHQAEEIAFDCIANSSLPNFSDASDRPSKDGRKIANVWVLKDWAEQTETDKIGLIGSGSSILRAKALALYEDWAEQTDIDKIGLIDSGVDILLAKALALYVKTYNQLH
jgi:hypothetical protein